MTKKFGKPKPISKGRKSKLLKELKRYEKARRTFQIGMVGEILPKYRVERALESIFGER